MSEVTIDFRSQMADLLATMREGKSTAQSQAQGFDAIEASIKKLEASFASLTAAQDKQTSSAQKVAKSEVDMATAADRAELAATRLGTSQGRSYETLIKVGGQYAEMLRNGVAANSDLMKAWQSGLSPAERTALNLTKVSVAAEDATLGMRHLKVGVAEATLKLDDQIRRQDTNVGSQNKLSRSLSELMDAQRLSTDAGTVFQATLQHKILEAVTNVDSGIGKLSAKFVTFGEDGTAALTDVGKATVPFIAGGLAVAGAVAAAGAGMVKMALNAYETIDAISDLADRTGVSATELSKFQYASKQLDIPMETLAGGLQKFSKFQVEAADSTSQQAKVMTGLGIQVKDTDGKFKSSIDVMAEYADRIASTTSGSEQVRLALEGFGKSGAELLPILKLGSAGIREMADANDRLGLTLTDEAIAKSNQYEQASKDLTLAIHGTATEIGVTLLPGLTWVSEYVSNNIAQWKAWLAVTGQTEPVVNAAADSIRVLNVQLDATQTKITQARQGGDASLIPGLEQSEKHIRAQIAALEDDQKALAKTADATVSLADKEKAYASVQELVKESEKASGGYLAKVREERAKLRAEVDKGTLSEAQMAEGMAALNTIYKRGAAEDAAKAQTKLNEALKTAKHHAEELATTSWKAFNERMQETATSTMPAAEVASRNYERAIKDLREAAFAGYVTNEEYATGVIKAKTALDAATPALKTFHDSIMQQGPTPEQIAESSTALKQGADNAAKLAKQQSEIANAGKSAISSVGSLAGQVSSSMTAAVASDEKQIESLQKKIEKSTSATDKATLQGRINTLKKKEKAEQEGALVAFRIQQGAGLAGVGINTAEAVMKAMTYGPIAGPIIAGVDIGLGAVEAGLILAQTPPGGGASSPNLGSAPSTPNTTGAGGTQLRTAAPSTYGFASAAQTSASANLGGTSKGTTASSSYSGYGGKSGYTSDVDVKVTDAFIPAGKARTVRTTDGDAGNFYQPGGPNDPATWGRATVGELRNLLEATMDQNDILRQLVAGAAGGRIPLTNNTAPQVQK